MQIHRAFTLARKATAAAVIAAGAAVVECTPGGVTVVEWIVVGVAAAVAYLTVYWIKNADGEDDSEDERPGRHEAA